MRKLELDEIRAIQMDILLRVDKLCQEEELTYELAYGTLIGAVRHQGYIPWDDDIDLIMPYPDYRKLIDIVNKQGTDGILDGRYRFAAALVESDLPYHASFMKVYDNRTRAGSSALKSGQGFREGVFIDIFPLSGLPDSEADRTEVLERFRRVNDGRYYRITKPQRWELNPLYPKRAVKNAWGYLSARFKPASWWVARCAEILEDLPAPENSPWTCVMPGWGADGKSLLVGNPWFPTKRVPFEGHSLPIPEQYDLLLRHQYGDYRKLPPKEEQVTSHDQDFYLLEEGDLES